MSPCGCYVVLGGGEVLGQVLPDVLVDLVPDGVVVGPGDLGIEHYSAFHANVQ